MNTLFKFIIRTSIFIVYFSVHAQTFRVKHYTTLNGLPSSQIFQVSQDERGFIWLATEGGLSRYDGKNFMNYDVANGLVHNVIMSVCPVKDGRVYFSYLRDKLGVIQKDSIFPSLKDSNLRDVNLNLIEYNNGIYFLSGRSNLMLYDLTTKKLSRQKSPQFTNVNFLYKTINNSVYIGAEKGLYTLAKNKITKCHYKGLPADSIYAISQNKDALWVAIKNRIYKIKNNTVVDSIIIPKDKQIEANNLVVNNAGLMLLYSHNNSIYYIKKTEKPYQTIELGTEFSVQKNSVTNFFVDKNDRIWISTYNNGLYCVENTPILLNNIHNPLFNLSINNIKVDKEEKAIYYSTATGLYKETSTVVTPYLYGTTNVLQYVYDISLDNQTHEPLVAISNNELAKNYPNTIHRKIINNKPINFILARSFFFNDDTTLLVFKWGESLLLRRRNNEFKYIGKLPGFIGSSEKHFVSVNKIYKHPTTHQVLILTTDGLFSLLPDLSFNKLQYPIRLVNDVLFDNDGRIWIASDNGLYILHQNRIDSLKTIGSHTLNTVRAIKKDQYNRIWLGTKNGLYIFNSKDSTYINQIDGLVSNEINALCINPISNQMILGTNQGVCKINLAEFNPFYKKDLTIYFKHIISKYGTYELTNPIKLSYKETNIKITFEIAELMDYDNLIFYYKLDQENWTKLSGSQIEFLGINYGDHYLQIKATKDGINFGRISELQFTINTPFYNTVWFYVLCGFTAVMIVLLIIYRMKVKQKRKLAEEKINNEKQLNNLKFQALNAAINPHFIFNSLNSIQTLINANENDEASTYLVKFSRLIRLIVDNAKENFVSIAHEEKLLSFYLQLEKMRFKEKLNFEIQCDSLIDKENTLIPNMVVQPFVENAILHGLLPQNGGHLSISFKKEDEAIVITINDNGVGINTSVQKEKRDYHKSIGMANITERLASISRAKLSIIDKKEINSTEQGTLVSLYIPNIH